MAVVSPTPIPQSHQSDHRLKLCLMGGTNQHPSWQSVFSDYGRSQRNGTSKAYLSEAESVASTQIAEADFAEVLTKASNNYDSLTQTEMLRLIALLSRHFRVWEEAFLLPQTGYLEKRAWEPILRQFSGYMGVRPFYEVWAIRKQYFEDEFQEFVNNLDPVDHVLTPRCFKMIDSPRPILA